MRYTLDRTLVELQIAMNDRMEIVSRLISIESGISFFLQHTVHSLYLYIVSTCTQTLIHIFELGSEILFLIKKKLQLISRAYGKMLRYRCE